MLGSWNYYALPPLWKVWKTKYICIREEDLSVVVTHLIGEQNMLVEDGKPKKIENVFTVFIKTWRMKEWKNVNHRTVHKCSLHALTKHVEYARFNLTMQEVFWQSSEDSLKTDIRNSVREASRMIFPIRETAWKSDEREHKIDCSMRLWQERR